MRQNDETSLRPETKIHRHSSLKPESINIGAHDSLPKYFTMDSGS